MARGLTASSTSQLYSTHVAVWGAAAADRETSFGHGMLSVRGSRRFEGWVEGRVKGKEGAEGRCCHASSSIIALWEFRPYIFIMWCEFKSEAL